MKPARATIVEAKLCDLFQSKERRLASDEVGTLAAVNSRGIAGAILVRAKLLKLVWPHAFFCGGNCAPIHHVWILQRKLRCELEGN